MGEARDTTDPDLYRVGRWERVEGNPFHNGKLRLSTSTYAPDWSVSGEELLRGWERRTGQETDGLIAVDVVALADMLRVTGPVEAPIYGTLDAGNFTAEDGRRLRRLPRQRGPPRPQPRDRARSSPSGSSAPATASRRSSRCATSAAARHFAHVDARPRPAVRRRRHRARRRAVGHRPRLHRGLQPEHQPQQVRLLAAAHGRPATSGSARTARRRSGSPSRSTTTPRPTPTSSTATRAAAAAAPAGTA